MANFKELTTKNDEKFSVNLDMILYIEPYTVHHFNRIYFNNNTSLDVKESIQKITE